MKSHNAALLLFAFSGLISVLLAIVAGPELPIQKQFARSAGLVAVAVGMITVLLAVRVAGPAFHGRIEPVTESLATKGVYRWIRHPIYAGFVLALAGVSLAARSVPGLVSVLLLFLPSCVVRARLEETALATHFGPRWSEYKARTAFMIPFLW